MISAGLPEAAHAKVLNGQVSEELAAIVLDSIEETQEIFRLANDVVIKYFLCICRMAV